MTTTGAYTRDPYALFLERQQRHRAPLNREPQPVLYKNMTLRTCLGDNYDPGETLEFVEVNWRTGVANIFLDAEDALNKVPYETIECAMPPCTPRSARDYIREAEAFAVRGHSLGHMECRCEHLLQNERAAELGISINDERGSTCPLDNTPCAFSAEQLSWELGLHDVKTAITAEGWPIWDVLCFRGTLNMQQPQHSDGRIQISANVVHVGGIQSKADLHRAVDTAKYVFRVPAQDSYPGMTSDISELIAAGKAWGVYDGTLLYKRDRSLELDLDPDVRRTWNHAAVV